MKVPTLDFSLLLDVAEDHQRQASQDLLLDALSQLGFVKIVNHGIPESVIHEMLDWVCIREDAIGSWAKLGFIGSRLLHTSSRNKGDDD